MGNLRESQAGACKTASVAFPCFQTMTLSTLNSTEPPPTFPAGQANYGFKEWAGVCELLAAGSTSLILRRGGIAEGRQGFRFEHDTFFLFPTLFHEQDQKIAWEAPQTRITHGTVEPGSTGTVRLHLAARIEEARTLTDWDAVARLARFHPWTEEIIRERFTWREGAEINLALVRVYQLVQLWEFPNSPTFGGCRSWVKLPALDEAADLTPVLPDGLHTARLAEIRGLLD